MDERPRLAGCGGSDLRINLGKTRSRWAGSGRGRRLAPPGALALIRYRFLISSCAVSGSLPARLLCPWDFSSKNTGVGCLHPSPGHLPDPGIEPGSPASPAL